MMREPAATSQTRQVRGAAKILTKEDYLPSSFGCVDTRKLENRRFAQSLFINVDGHDVISRR
jgi:hypothetical protein